MDKDTYEKITKEAWIIRGSMISNTSILEQHMEEIIGKYFCTNNEKSDELIAVIIGTTKLTFDGKTQILKYVLEKKHTNFIKDNKCWVSDFEKIMKVRNILAHHPVSFNEETAAEEYKKGRIGFTKFNNKMEINYYTKEDIKTHGIMIVSYIKKFRELLNI